MLGQVDILWLRRLKTINKFVYTIIVLYLNQIQLNFMKKTILFLLLILSSFASNAQLVVNNSNTPTELVQNVLLGNNVYISNVKFNGSLINGTMLKDQVTSFSNGATTNIGINQGLLLSTGKGQVAIGPNNSGSATQASSIIYPGDNDLALITTGTINNKASLEFDFVAQGDNISFNFVFGSEEYLEFVNSSFNDVFGFFISGPGISGPFEGNATNIALIPNTTIPISIDTVNSNVNSAFYVNNGTGATPLLNSTIQFDGFTTVLPATAAIQCGETYHIKLAIANVGDNAFDSAVFLQSGSFSSTLSTETKLVAFVDANNNGIKDSNEINFPNGTFLIEKNNSGTINSITVPTGSYSIFDSTGTNSYNFNYAINSEFAPYYSLVPTNYTNINIPITSINQTYYFPIQVTQTFEDVSVNVIPLTSPRSGFEYLNRIVYQNNSLTTSSGVVSFANDPQVTTTTISQAGTTSTATGFTHNYDNLTPFESRTIDVSMAVPAIPIVNIGDLLTNSASINGPLADVNLTNNSSTNTQAVVAAYDPNMVIENHGGKIFFNQFGPNDYLYYTINFENIGNGNALNVKINDILDSKIDETSIRMINASHNYILERNGANLKWSFNNILLPPSVANTQIGKGYATFKVKLKPGFAIGDIIPNTASIYFDNNPAIITNTFNTEFIASLTNEDINAGTFSVYPNPTNSNVQVSLQNSTDAIQNITIYDVLGKSVKTINKLLSNEISVDVSNFSKGIYFIEITTNNNLKSTKKLVVN